MSETNRTTSADYMRDVIGLSDIEVTALESAGYSADIMAEVAVQQFEKGSTIEEVRGWIKEQFPEAFSFKLPKCAADLQDKIHRYLWKPYIPMDDYSILMAAAGTGKTLFCSWLASQVTNGGFIKGDTDYYSQEEARRTGSQPEPSNVLYISSEEEAEELRHRLIESGGNPSRFFIYDREDSIDMNFTDGYTDFTLKVKSCNPKLVIIDPWQAFIGEKVDTNKVNHVRPALQKLATIAKQCGCAIVLISHVNKKPQSENINNAAIGSSEFVNAARSGMMLIHSDVPDEYDTRILVHTKANYSAAGDSLKFHITPTGGMVYDGISLVTRSILEKAARDRKTVAEVMAQQKEERTVRTELITAIKEMAVPGQSVIVAYDELMDKYGDDIFGGVARPGTMLKKIMPALKAFDIEIDTKTATGKPKTKTYNGKHVVGFEIYQKQQKDS